jgi:Tfp pilus assembly protein FimT
LIELMLVLALITLLISIAVPRSGSPRHPPQ